MADAAVPAQLLQAQPVAQQELIILGLPLTFLIILIVLIFVIMMLGFLFIYYWKQMGPVRGYFGASRNSSEVGLLCRQSGRVSLINTKYITKIFNDMGTPLSWIQRSDESFQLGNCPLKIITDNTGICTEPAINQAIKEWVVYWNDRELRRQAYFEQKKERLMEEGHMQEAEACEYRPALIRDYEDLYQMCINGEDSNGNPVEVPQHVKIHAVAEVPMQSIQHYLAHIGPGDLEGHIAYRITEDAIAQEEEHSMPKWAQLLLILIAVMGIVTVFCCYMITR